MFVINMFETQNPTTISAQLRKGEGGFVFAKN